MSNLAEIKAKLYVENEYGVSYQNPNARLDPEDVKLLVDKYGIRTDVHRSCINCQARQMIKFGGRRDQDAKLIEEFRVPCKGIAKSLPPGSAATLRRMIVEENMDPQRAELLLKSTTDPVAWATLMFGFDDSDPTWNLRAYQKEQLRCTSEKLVIREGRRSGKALPLDTPVPTPSGWTTMGDLVVGDSVFGPDGKPTEVTFVTETMYDHVVYNIVFDDGSTMLADAEHQWAISSRSSRRRHRQGRLTSDLYTCTTQDLVDGKILIGKKSPEFNYRVELTEPVQYEQKFLEVHPYVLGYWLGDGVRGTGRIAIGLEDQEETCNRIEALGYKMRRGGHSDIDCNVYGLSGRLKDLGIREEKRIPRKYLQASVSQRWELLRGLMDSDGSVDTQGHSSYCTVDPGLAEDFYELACSLGLKVTRTLGESWLDGARYKDRHRFYFNTSERVFALARKQARIDATAQCRAPRDYRAIVSIEPAPSVPVRCITVDNDRHLYLAGKQFLVTHNTFIIALKLLYLALNREVQKGFKEDGTPDVGGPEIMVVTPFQSQLLNIFDEMEKLLKRNSDLTKRCKGVSGGSLYVKTPYFHLDFTNGAVVNGFVSGVATKADGSGGGTMRGRNANVIYLDEMDMIPEETLNKVVLPILLTDAKGEVMLIATSTPIGKRAKFFEWCIEDETFKEDHLPSTVLPQWEKNKRTFENEGSKEDFDKEYMALFVDTSYGVFKPSYVYASMRDYEINRCSDETYLRKNMGVLDKKKLFVCIGIDWNKNAGTEFVVVGYDPLQHQFMILDIVNVQASEFSSMRWKEEVVRLNYKWQPDYIYADEGYGHTIIEDLKVLSAQTAIQEKTTRRDVETAKIKDRLVSFNFSSKVELRSPIDGAKIQKSGKEFIVEFAVRVMEDGLLWMPSTEDHLRKQMLNYVVLRRSPTTSKPVYGAESDRVGDHRLDALMLALAGIQLENGLYSGRSMAQSQPRAMSREFLDERAAGRTDRDDSSPGSEVLALIKRQQTTFPGAVQLLQTMRPGETAGEAARRNQPEPARVQRRSRDRMDSGEPSVAEWLLGKASDYRGYGDDTEHLYEAERSVSSHVVGRRKERKGGRRTIRRRK